MQIYKKLAGFLVLIAAVALVAVSPVWADDAKPKGKLAAEVNGVPVYQEDVDKRLDVLLSQIADITSEKPTEDELAELKRRILYDLIEYKMLLNESEKQGVSVTDEDVNNELTGIKSQFPSEADFINALKQAGISEAEFTQTIKDTLLVQRLLDKQLEDQIKVTDAEAKAFYDATPGFSQQAELVHARHILKMVEPNASPIDRDKKKKELEEVLKALKNGSDFGELAMKYSDDPSKISGGDLGYFPRGRMVQPFEDAAFALKPGEVSGIVETQFGYHIIKVEDHQPARTLPYDEETKQSIISTLSMQKKQEAADKYIQNLRETGDIKIFME